MNVRQAWYHKKAASVSVMSWSIRMGMTILLYYFIYRLRNGDAVNGIDFQVAAGGMIIYAIYAGSGYRSLFPIINREFKTGGIEIWINKPINYIQLKIAEVFGKSIPVVLGLILAATAFWVLSGQFPQVGQMPLRIGAGFVLLLLGLLIATLLYALVGISAIWLIDAQPAYLILDKLIMIFGGAYIPIGFFPQTFRLVGELLPTGAAIYVTQLFYPDFLTNFPRFLITQIIWALVLLFVVYRAYISASTKLTVNGG